MGEKALLSRTLSFMIRQSLRRSFRRVCWIGEVPSVPENVPLVLYSNHNYFHDSYLLWLTCTTLLERHTTVWMADWDRFPFFSPLGALPFPPHDAPRRIRTIRRTIQRFREGSNEALIYFPEGQLHSPDEDLLPVDLFGLERIQRLLAPAMWLPVGVYLTWSEDALPTARLSGGEVRDNFDGYEMNRLNHVLRTIRKPETQSCLSLLEGKHSPHETWNFSFLSKYFSRFL